MYPICARPPNKPHIRPMTTAHVWTRTHASCSCSTTTRPLIHGHVGPLPKGGGVQTTDERSPNYRLRKSRLRTPGVRTTDSASSATARRARATPTTRWSGTAPSSPSPPPRSRAARRCSIPTPPAAGGSAPAPSSAGARPCSQHRPQRFGDEQPAAEA